MIAIDTLVHNLLVRTGILARFAADHSYGAACYQASGCAEIIEAVAQADRCPAVQSRVSAAVSAVRSACDLAVLRPVRASTSATATGLMIGSLARMFTAKFAVIVIV